MNFPKLFIMQKTLDDRIIKEKGLQGQDLFPNTILALQVELGELANECRFFKHWSDNREMKRDKALIEYVDCLHFVLSIGLKLGVTNIDFDFRTEGSNKYGTLTQQFNWVYRTTSSLAFDRYIRTYKLLVYEFLSLGEMLGFTWNEIEQAYIRKNKVNHERQTNGY